AFQYTRVDFLLSYYNINPDRLVLTETTGGSGAAAYNAGQFINAAYVKADVAVLPLVRVAGGLRFESAKQRVGILSLFKNETAERIAPRKEEYILPTATVTWNFADDMQLRMGLSKTIGRPQFRELAPQVYLDPEQDRLFVGNPYLKDTELMNFDARYEWYYESGRHFTAGFFYKKMDNAVEATIQDTGSGEGQQTYLNAPKANLYGLEFDYKGQFDSPIEGAFFDSKKWILQANYTWTKSELQVGDGDVVYTLGGFGKPSPAKNFLKDGAKLQGQSEHVVNAQFGWEDADAKSQATLLLTYVSERVSARGKPGYADYIQKPGTMLDFVYRKGFTAFDRELKFGLEARNLLGTEYQEYQEQGRRIDINKYDLGRSVSVSLSTEF
ncbi:MAG: TonB-dependent receptor domain-containing protein, partial [Asticcacaulis sp.]